MFEFVNTTFGNLYNPNTHEIKPRREFVESEIERKENLIKQLMERVTETTTILKEEIDDLKKQLKDYK